MLKRKERYSTVVIYNAEFPFHFVPKFCKVPTLLFGNFNTKFSFSYSTLEQFLKDGCITIYCFGLEYRRIFVPRSKLSLMTFSYSSTQYLFYGMRYHLKLSVQVSCGTMVHSSLGFRLGTSFVCTEKKSKSSLC